MSEATGRNKLTTAGIALGTPAYMAPEQAAADPNLDHRVDIYALGAMGYELLSGRPPFTGLSAQEILAAHVTQRPEPLTNRRPACPPAVAAVLMKCLEKRPADRWQTAEELLTQLEPLATPSGGMTPTQTRPVEAISTARPLKRSGVVAVVGAVVAIAAIAAWFTLRSHRAIAPVSLRDRVQITSNGLVTGPSISSDGKQLAYLVSDCREQGCRYGVEIQDVGGASTRRVVDGATAAYWVTWSPDRRSLLFGGTLAGRYGTYLVSLLGDPPRFLTPGQAMFIAGGDSLLVVPISPPDTVGWMWVSGLDGIPRDSIRIVGFRNYAWPVRAVPNSPWLIVGLARPLSVEFLTIDRQGRVGDRWMLHGETAGGADASGDALWVQVRVSASDGGSRILRIPLDGRSGKFSDRVDTVYSGVTTGLGVTADGARLVVDEGTTEYSGWALETADLLRGDFAEQRRRFRSTKRTWLSISPYGDRVLISRPGGSTSGGDVVSAAPFAGGAEVSLAVTGSIQGWSWGWDSMTVSVGERTPAGFRLSEFNVRTGVAGAGLLLPDSTVSDWDLLPAGGWVWIPRDAGRVLRLQRPGDAAPRTFMAPASYQTLQWVDAAADGQRVAITGWNAKTVDTSVVSVVSLADGRVERWAGFFGEETDAFWLPDGSMVVEVWETMQSPVIYRVRGPGQIERIGAVSRPVASVRFSLDLRRATVVTREYHGDAWMSTVVRP